MNQEVTDVDQNCMRKLLVARANAVEGLKNEEMIPRSFSASSYTGIKKQQCLWSHPLVDGSHAVMAACAEVSLH
jgi:hypothetical protein